MPWDGNERRTETRRSKCSHCPINEDGVCSEHGVIDERMKTMRSVAVWSIGTVGSIAGIVLVLIVPIMREMSAKTGRIETSVAKMEERYAERFLAHAQKIDVIETRQGSVIEKLGQLEGQMIGAHGRR